MQSLYSSDLESSALDSITLVVINVPCIIFIVCAVISRCFCMHCFCVAFAWRPKQFLSLRASFRRSMGRCFPSHHIPSAPRSRISTGHCKTESLQFTSLYLRCFYEVFICLTWPCLKSSCVYHDQMTYYQNLKSSQLIRRYHGHLACHVILL